MKNKQGISLIVLIITIIVMIILASTIILSVTRNNIINNVGEAKFKSNGKTYQEELALSLADIKMKKPSTVLKEINANTGSEVKQYIPSMTEEDLDKYVIQNGELAYKLTMPEKERKYAEDDGIIREIEVFNTTTDYGTLYINPKPTKLPDNIPLEFCSIDSYDNIGSSYIYNGTISALKTSYLVKYFPQSVFVGYTEENELYYFWDDYKAEKTFAQHVHDGEDKIVNAKFDLKKGWNRVVITEDEQNNSINIVSTVVSNDALIPFENIGMLSLKDELYGGEYVGNYISTVKY